MGAWIEIPSRKRQISFLRVAPVWGRGLKSGPDCPGSQPLRRPRMGAWIEISPGAEIRSEGTSPPYGGVD